MKGFITILMLLFTLQTFSQYQEKEKIKPDYYAISGMVGTIGYFSAIALDYEQKNHTNNQFDRTSNEVILIYSVTTILVGTFIHLGIRQKSKNIELTPTSLTINF